MPGIVRSDQECLASENCPSDGRSVRQKMSDWHDHHNPVTPQRRYCQHSVHRRKGRNGHVQKIHFHEVTQKLAGALAITEGNVGLMMPTGFQQG